MGWVKTSLLFVASFLFIGGIFFVLIGLGTVDSSNTLETLTGRASNSSLFLCVNQPPTLSTVNCTTTFNQTTALENYTQDCQLNITDADVDSYVVSANWTTSTEDNEDDNWYAIFINDTLRLTPRQGEVGSQTLNVSVLDSSTCTNAETSSLFSFTILDINDPPELLENIPPVTFSSGTVVSPFGLYTYFSDPDVEALNFTFYGNTITSLSIDSGTSNVLFSSTECGNDIVIFRATDQSGLSTDSNPVSITVDCTTSSSGTGGDGDEDSGGGSSGGGGSSNWVCTPQWKCDSWSKCYINGTREKYCKDINACDSDDYERTFWEECEYIPTCSDGVMNGEETGIDCGGNCPACPTCDDGFMNGDETGIDCGGSCRACNSCSDGILNWGEEDIDCGGPYCAVCPTCDDGFMNGDETGIDCGGSCGACSTVELPTVITDQSPLTLTMALLVFLVLLAMVLLRVYRKKVSYWLAHLGWFLAGKHHKTIYLSDELKKHILEKLSLLDKELHPDEEDDITVDYSDVLETILEQKRYFFSQLFSLTFFFTEQDFTKQLHNIIKSKTLQSVLTSFYKESLALEQEKVQLDAFYCLTLIQEFREIIFQMSRVVNEDYSFTATELDVLGDQKQQFELLFYNTILALQFEDIDAAKKHYLALLTNYNDMHPGMRSKYFIRLDRVYSEIKYLLSWKN